MSFPQINYAVCILVCYHPVGYNDYSTPIAVKLCKMSDNLTRVFRVEIAGGLIRQDNSWLVEKRSRYGCTLTFPGAEFRRFVVFTF